MQVIQSAIRDFRMNTGNFLSGFNTIGRTNLFATQYSLCFSQTVFVFSGITRIGNFVTVIGNKQVFNSHINTNGFIGFGQDLIFKFAQAGHKVTACTIFGNSDCGGNAWQTTRPAYSKRLFTFGDVNFAIRIFKSTFGELSRLLTGFFLERRVLAPSFKEVFKGRLLMAQYLLSGNAGYFIQKSKLRHFLEFSQSSICLKIANVLFALIVPISTPAQYRVIDKSHTPKGLSKQFNLIRRGVKTISISSVFHVSHFNNKNVKLQIISNLKEIGTITLLGKIKFLPKIL